MSKDAVLRLSEVLSQHFSEGPEENHNISVRIMYVRAVTQTVHITQRVAATLTLLAYVICFVIRVVYLTTLPLNQVMYREMTR